MNIFSHKSVPETSDKYGFCGREGGGFKQSKRLVGCKLKAHRPLEGPGPIKAVPSVGGLSKGS